MNRINYDPNVNFCTQLVELRLAQWQYRATEMVQVRGNLKGAAVLLAAVRALYEKLEEFEGIKHVTLKLGGDVLHVEDDEQRDSDWLEELVISARILQIVPDKERTAAHA
jgi:hypothetical protein